MSGKSPIGFEFHLMSLIKYAEVAMDSSLTELDDEELIKLLNDQNREEILSLLYERYVQKVLFKVKTLVGGGKQVSEDLTHDIFIRIFTKLHQFRQDSKFSLWVYRISMNSCYDYLRKKKQMIEKEWSQDLEQEIEIDDEFELKVLREIKIAEMEQLLQELSTSDRVLLMMKYGDDLKVREMAQLLGKGESAIKMQLKRARKKLLTRYILKKK